MVNIDIAKKEFKKFLDKYNNEDDPGFKLKIVHTNYVVENARDIACKLKLSDDDIALAELIGLLHDIGRFEEITFLKEFDNIKFDHAGYGVKMLFEDNLIRTFIDDDSYDSIIKVAIDNHSRLFIVDGLEERELLHSKIIRDADKLDNFRVKLDEKIENIFPGKIKDKSEMENSTISLEVMEKVREHKPISLNDRKTILDYWICVLAFVFDLNFDLSLEIVKENNYIDLLIDRFEYKDTETKMNMEEIRQIIKKFIDDKITYK